MAEKIKRLYRSKDRIIAGVCGGIAEYLEIDPAIVRLVWLLAALAWGTGLLAYLVAWIIIPEAPEGKTTQAKGSLKGFAASPAHEKREGQAAFFFGVLLIAFGALLLAQNVGWIPRIRFELTWPVLLIVLGIALLAKYARRE